MRKMSAATREYIADRAIRTNGGRYLVPDSYITPPPARIARSLTAHFGRARTIDRGEVAYWDVTDYLQPGPFGGNVPTSGKVYLEC